MKLYLSLCALGLVSGVTFAAEQPKPGDGGLSQLVGRRFLPRDAANSTWSAVYHRVAEADAAADSAWRRLANRAEYDAYRLALRDKMLEAIGPFPERTPLNFRTVRSFQKDGYRVDHVLFESMPGVLVPANLFVPTAEGFKAPHPAVVLSCGHGYKDDEDYLRACVVLVKRGIVAFMFEPYEQGERVEFPVYDCCQNHNLIGLKAMLLGGSMAGLRLWDGIRAIDCVETLPYVDRNRIGYAGNSGGGTMTALMTAVDLRLRATAPSCFLSNFGYLCRTMGPQDGEQNIFGQLAFGLNHTGYVLIPDTKVAVTGRFHDMFDYGGTAQLMETVRALAARVGTSDHYALNFSHGPHGWTESTIQGTADWMGAWLLGEKNLLPLDTARTRAADYGFDLSAADVGLAKGERGVFGGKKLAEMPGFRSIHDILRERAATARKGWKTRTPDETAALVKRLAVIRSPAETGVKPLTLKAERSLGRTVTQIAFFYPDGYAIPGVLIEPPNRAPGAVPVLLAGTKGRVAQLAAAEQAVAGGAPVLLVDVSGTGEIGRLMFAHYGAEDTPEEGVSIMLYLLGESMTGRRAGELWAAADWLKARFGAAPALVAEGSVAVAAAHARAAARAAFSSVRFENPPPSWTDFLSHPGAPLAYRYTWCVNGALNEYDWIEL